MRKLVIVVLVLIAGALVWANWPASPLSAGAKVDRIVITKSARVLALMRGGIVVKEYRVSLGRNPTGAKVQDGDSRTPEGMNRITEHKRDSAFHRALRISYPEDRDVANATRRGVSPGSDIMIHGMKNGLGLIGRLHQFVDWTAGCIAVTDSQIEDIYRVVLDGTPVEIRP